MGSDLDFALERLTVIELDLSKVFPSVIVMGTLRVKWTETGWVTQWAIVMESS